VERGEKGFLQAAHALDRLLGDRRLAERRLVRPDDVDLLLDEAVLALRAVEPVGRFLVAELDDLDALHVTAHRLELPHGVEVAVARPLAVGVGTDGVGLRAGVAADHLGVRGNGDRGRGERGSKNEWNDAHGAIPWDDNGMLPRGARAAQPDRRTTDSPP